MSNVKPQDTGISFELSPEQQKALKTLAGGRQVRLGGVVSGDKLKVNFIACNSPFVACNAPFAACNAPFAACNAPFAACNAPFAGTEKSSGDKKKGG